MTAPTPVQTFMEEARELLGELEEALLELEVDPGNHDTIDRAFRALHTIKGSGAMFGFSEVARFTHSLETAFDKIRSGSQPLSSDLLSLSLLAKDHLQHLLLSGRDADTLPTESDALLAKIAAVVEPSASTDQSRPVQGDRQAANEYIPETHDTENGNNASASATFWIRYTPALDTFRTGCDPLNLMREVSELGPHAFVYHAAPADELSEHDTESPHGFWDVVLSTRKGLDAIHDVFVFVDDGESVIVEIIGDGTPREGDLEHLVEIAKSHATHTEEIPRLMRSFLAAKLTLRKQGKTKSIAPFAADSSIRVDSSRLDRLVNMVGEMVILQSRLSQAVQHSLDQGSLAQIAEDLERLTDEMRDNTLGLRMLPIGTIYGSLRRLVRDLACNLGKDVDFVTDGGETELDKTVIDRLKDPLVHILRNSLDHGLEAPDVRIRAGKTAQGTVRLWAGHVGGEVVIRVMDDGQGLDSDKIRKKAQDSGLITGDTEPDRRDLMNLVFEPGFTTAKEISDLSGRGVGMDVVKRSIDALRGTVEIDSEPGRGTTLTIRLPLTLAIIDGFCVEIGKGLYIVPLTALRGFQERETHENDKSVDIIERMGQAIPCVSLRRLFRVRGTRPAYERVVIAEVDGVEIGLAVDRIIGRQQAVIKSLDAVYKSVAFLSGTTINGDGTISLILDIPRLIEFSMAHAGNTA